MNPNSVTPEQNPYDIGAYDYDLPEELIAQHPADIRQDSRLLVVSRADGTTAHRRFYQIADLLCAGDVLVVNNTKVIPARLFGHKASGGKIEVLLIDYAGRKQTGTRPDRFECRCLIRASKAPPPGTRLVFDDSLHAEVISAENGTFVVEFTCSARFEEILHKIGHVPLPPYIRRTGQKHDRHAYQTVYAAENGAVAAPTAGLHFSRGLLEKIRQNGVEIAEITLHVSYGTFMPVRVTNIREHQMHTEHYEISAPAADRINAARANGRRIVAVGTTSVRTLEYAADDFGHIQSGSGQCDLFIYPGYRFKAVDAMITNFHLPRSTLLMLVAAFAGKENIMAAYRDAISERYRFFSYGDAMFIQ
ncbi:MAG: tRNA preQ1(34) S-adenosylmethionine ribosyltransferase-isomerase QueA [Desulfosalsimonas sp.]|uniref:tRNA preQ1(34) S-adenosylmethionine ribosyltransferase-isomerase QueA n=1 Tax=Desulfosalsimonas sp. TaxID=3073848 RepID=UPI0039705B80